MGSNEPKEGEVLVVVCTERDDNRCASAANKGSGKRILMHFFVVQWGPKQRRSDQLIRPTSAYVCARNEFSGRGEGRNVFIDVRIAEMARRTSDSVISNYDERNVNRCREERVLITCIPG